MGKYFQMTSLFSVDLPQLFIIEGVMTVGIALIFAFILPNSNKKIWGMNELEIRWAQWNFESDQGQLDNAKEGTAWQGLVMAVRDPKTWLFTGILYAVSILPRAHRSLLIR